METVKVCFSSTEEIRSYLDLAEGFLYNMDLQCGSRIVDGKSVLGILSFGLRKTLELRFHTDDRTAISQFLERIAFCIINDNMEMAI